VCGAAGCCLWPTRWARACGACYDEVGAFAPSAIAERLGNERIWGLGCVGGGTRCGVAWNTLVPGPADRGRHHGTWARFIALSAERGYRGLQAAERAGPVADHHAAFRGRLGLILLFGRAGLVNQFLEYAFGIPPTRWFYGSFGVWLAQMFAFTPIAFMIMRGVVQGVSPSLEEAAQTLRASRWRTFTTVTLPLLKPGLANAFLVGFIESIADFGNPIVVGGSTPCCRPTSSLPSWARNTTRGGQRRWRSSSPVFALVVFFVQQRVLGKSAATPRSRARATPACRHAAARQCSRVCYGVALPWLAFTVVVYVFAFIGGFVQTWGRDYTPPSSTSSPPSICSGAAWPGVGWHRVELALHHRSSWRPLRRRCAPAWAS
jgi:iron(III) transport system permease protein